MPSGGELSATLRFLGAGVGVADIDGLKVAFASGGGGDDGSASVDGAFGADVLLTAEWPQGVCRGIADAGARAVGARRAVYCRARPRRPAALPLRRAP
jgi:hypothetical protein